MPVFFPLLIIVLIAVVAVLVFGVSASMIGYGLLKTTAKFGSSSPAPAPTAPPVSSSGWTIQYSPNMPAQMPQDADGNYYFDFPNQDGVHYVVKAPPSLQLGQLVTLSFNISGPGVIVSVQGNTPTVSLYMQRRGDNLSGSGPYQQYRYFHGGIPLVTGDATVSCTLTPDQWGDVFGSNGMDHQPEFAACVANAGAIGFVFGDPGAGATGHGVYSSGSNRFTLKAFTIA